MLLVDTLGSDPWLNIQQIFWPALTLGLGIGAAILRTTRGAMLDVARQGYVRAARGRGLGPRLVTIKHVLRNALIPIGDDVPGSSSATCWAGPWSWRRSSCCPASGGCC